MTSSGSCPGDADSKVLRLAWAARGFLDLVNVNFFVQPG